MVRLIKINKDLSDSAQKDRVYYDVVRLDKEIIDSHGFLSAGGTTLSQDRLLAHVSNRLMLSKDGGWG